MRSSFFHTPTTALVRQLAGFLPAGAVAPGDAARQDVAERLGQKTAACVMRLTLVVALLSASMPLTPGHVLPWAVVQFGGMALMGWLP
ncbi:hypothetical protein KBW71_17535, partial [Hydrogenophaga aromaticivorans]|nr:hypothetical protein [Hydrogenophaga aromaticivorans]